MKRQTITPEYAQRVWTIFNEQGIEEAKQFHFNSGFKKSSFYRIIQNYGEWQEKQSFERNRKWTDQQIDFVIQQISNNSQLTLKELLDLAINNGYPEISISTLSSYLKLKLITYKQIHYIPQQRNAPRTKEIRIEYCRWVLQNQQLHFIYIDEFGFNLGLTRTKGRSPKGQPAFAYSVLQRGGNVSVIFAIDENGLINFLIHESAVKKDDFTTFISIVLEEVNSRNIQNACLIFDNCPSHSEEDFQSAFQYYNNAVYEFLPPYSPFLNPIEECINDIKQTIKTMLTIDFKNEILGITELPWGQKTVRRRKILEECLNMAMNSINPQKVRNHIAHSMSYMADCIEGKDIF